MIHIPIRNIYFDWSGTLARPGMRDVFLCGPTKRDRLSVLYPDTLDVLDYLTSRGYILGIITNTSKSKLAFIEALKQAGIYRYFEGAIIASSDPGMCKKACQQIFDTALMEDSALGSETMYIGNNFSKDVVGAIGAGLHAIYVNRTTMNNPYPFQVRQLCELKHTF